ncbi:MAG: S4 domain-containing protein, partial [Brevundimonas sp.]|uniref:S4 domain-containing protein n=1 Tax=Brevundimonas sp. TaxID=1871086 RepID=UPI00391A69EC
MKTRLDQLLVARGLFDTRARARAAIEAGGVTVDGEPAKQPSQKVDEDVAVTAEPAHRFVGRAALKLDHALTLWPVAVGGRVVLDVGASTGGFTEVCLEGGGGEGGEGGGGRSTTPPELADKKHRKKQW